MKTTNFLQVLFISVLLLMSSCSKEQTLEPNSASENSMTLNEIPDVPDFVDPSSSNDKNFTIHTEKLGALNFTLKLIPQFKMGGKECVYVGSYNGGDNNVIMMTAKNGFLLNFRHNEENYSIRKQEPLDFELHTPQKEAQKLLAEIRRQKISRETFQSKGINMDKLEKFATIKPVSTKFYTPSETIESGNNYDLVKKEIKAGGSCFTDHLEGNVKALDTKESKTSNPVVGEVILEAFNNPSGYDFASDISNTYLSLFHVIIGSQATAASIEAFYSSGLNFRFFDINDVHGFDIANNPSGAAQEILDYVEAATQVNHSPEQRSKLTHYYYEKIQPANRSKEEVTIKGYFANSGWTRDSNSNIVIGGLAHGFSYGKSFFTPDGDRVTGGFFISSTAFSPHITAHEIGHVFGARHATSSLDVMQASSSGAFHLLPVNISTIRSRLIQ